MLNANRFVVYVNNKAAGVQKHEEVSGAHTEPLNNEYMLRHVFDPLFATGVPILETERPTADALDDILQPNDVIVACGGDGTMNWLTNTLLAIGQGDKVSILPRPMGGMNDITKTLYGHKSLSHILEVGEQADAYTIEATISPENHSLSTYFALGYLGIGASALSAFAINQRAESSNSKIGDVTSAAKTVLLNARQFRYENEAGEEHDAFELLALSSRMAGFIYPHHPLMFEDAFLYLAAKTRLSALGKIGMSPFGGARGVVKASQQEVIITPLTDIILQLDGEDKQLKSRDDIRIRNGQKIKVVRAGR